MDQSLFDKHQWSYWHDLNKPATDGRTEVYIEDFHKQLVHRYRETVQLRHDLSTKRLDAEVARQGFNLLLRIFERLLNEGHVHYWLARAYAKQFPEPSTNRFFVSHHFYVLQTGWKFLDIKNIDDWKDTSVLNALRKPDLLPWKVGIEELAFVANRNQDRLPDLDNNYLKALQEESKLACDLLKEPYRAQTKPTPSQVATSPVEVLLGEESRDILDIANSTKKSADTKMREIYRIDRRFLAWDSPKWASLLKVDPAAIRKTAFWKADRPAAIEADKNMR